MIGSRSLICCNNFLHLTPHFVHHKSYKTNTALQLSNTTSLQLQHTTLFTPHNYKDKNKNKKGGRREICWVSDDPVVDFEDDEPDETSSSSSTSSSIGGDWSTSVLLFAFWVALFYYVFNLAPNQTPTTDMYFVKKLCNLVGDDGFRMNQVLVSLWYLMGLWPIVYSMLLLPSARSSKSSVPVWPFVTLSFFGGAYALIPYFILWRPPPPPVNEDEVGRWPLNFLESKITAGLVGAAGLGLIVYAGLNYNDWKEFSQYFRGSKLVHVTGLDFSLLSAFAPFWVYNDMTARKCYDKTAWLLPLSVVPFLGPALYLFLRPQLTTLPVSLDSTLKSD